MITTRFAPSPTGFLHIGGARTALFAYLYAKHHQGKFVVRIEDTDLARSNAKFVDAILEGLNWLGLKSDEIPIYQSYRLKRHQSIVKQLLSANKAYYCQCSNARLETLRKRLKAAGKKPKYDNKCRNLNLSSGVVRFKNPSSGLVIFDDLTKGYIRIANKELDDLIIARNDGSPTYNLSVVVDDHDIGITTVIRGDDHINNTPRQINLYQSLGWQVPKFAHLPMILGKDGSRLSKRHDTHGTMSILEYKEAGYLPEALLNYLVRLGWSYGDQELFSLKQMQDLFNLADVNRAAANFDDKKLLWLNSQYLKNTKSATLFSHLQYYLHKRNINTKKGANAELVIDLLKGRMRTLAELAEQMQLFYQAPAHYDKVLVKKHFHHQSLPILQLLLAHLTQLKDWQVEHIKAVIHQVCSEKAVTFAAVGQPLRLALSGNGIAPDITITTALVGREQTLLRLNKAISIAQ